jgi:hypothetical protein
MPRAQPVAKVRELLRTQADDARAKIQVGRAIETVQKMLHGEIVVEPALMNARIAAAPDMSSVEISGEDGGPLQININKVA